jgi:tetratricopeptide (TPR) repeat protein
MRPVKAMAVLVTCALGAMAPAAYAQMGGGMMGGSSSPQEDPTVPYNAGLAAFNAGNHAEAVRQLRAARRAAPNDNAINYALGLALNATGEKEDARQAFQRAARGRNAPFQARLQLGLVSLELGDREAAVEQQTALQGMITSCDARCGDERRGQIQTALDQLTRALTPS